MFDAIAPTYEWVNTVASFGRDAQWRRRTVAAADVRPEDVVLDVCCGTGDMVRAFAQTKPTPRLIIGLDFSTRMLKRGHFNGVQTQVRVIRGDALRMPLAPETADVISCVFGVRNFRDLQAGLAEMYRVARPGARVVILEFATPGNRALRWVYQVYCDHMLPLAAGVLSRERMGAYRYLARSIRTFETTLTMTRRLEDAGLRDVTARRMNLGGVVLYRGVKPGGQEVAEQ